MKSEITLSRTMTSVRESLEKASETLDGCVFPGPCSAAAMKSKFELLLELVDDEPREIGVSVELLEMNGVL